MSKKCDICGKIPQTGYQISHAHNKTKRRWNPNIQSIRVNVKGETKRMNVCARCIKSNRITKA